jgi:cell division protein FtsW
MKKKKIDMFFFGVTCFIVLIGLFALSSASIGLIARSSKSIFAVIFKQLVLGVGIGFILLFIFTKIPYEFWRKIALPLFLLSIAITLLVFAPKIGFSYGGARRWLNLGFLSLQPSEILKFSFVVYLASWLSSRKSNIASFQFGFLPFLMMIGVLAVILVLEPDIGTLGVIIITAGALFFIGGGKLSQLGALIALCFILIAVLAFLKPYVMSRVLVFLNPSLDPQGIGYQVSQSLIAIGSGGLFGRGFGMSVQKFNFLPEPVGDSIFAVIAEEFGFIGSVFLIILFLVFLFRGFHISKQAPDSFGRLLGSGIVILIVGQSFINIGALMGLLPLTGLPLLFISQGGTALAITLAEVGILLNISKYV